MTTTRNHRRIFTITAVVAAAALILVLALTALNRGSETAPAAGPAGANNVDRIEITSVDGKALTVPSTPRQCCISWRAGAIPAFRRQKR